MTTAIAPSTPLTALDRCDRCGAQAYLRVELTGGGELLFCAHHAREHGDKLREVAITVQDETDKLAANPSTSDRSSLTAATQSTRVSPGYGRGLRMSGPSPGGRPRPSDRLTRWT